MGGDLTEEKPREIDQAPIGLNLWEVQRIVGERLPAEEILRILEHLGFELTAERRDASEFRVQIPSGGLDVSRETALIEEIAREYGDEKFHNTLPSHVGSVIELPHPRNDQ